MARDATAPPPPPEPAASPVTTETVFDSVERWAATCRTIIALLLVAASSILEPQVLVGTLAFAAAAAATAWYVHARPHSLPVGVKALWLLLDTGLVGVWLIAMPSEPLVATLIAPVVVAWSIVYGPRWGLATGLVFTIWFTGARILQGASWAEVVAASGLIAVVLLSLVGTMAGLLAQLRGEWRQAQREQAHRRRQSDQHLEHLGRLAGTVAHEMNNNLTAILGLASLMRQDAVGNQRLEGDFDALDQACREGQRQVENLLGVAGRGELSMRPHEAASLVRQATHILRASLPKHVKLDLQLGRGLPAVHADSHAIARALLNLGINATEASRGSAMRLTVALSAAHVMPGEDDALPPGDWLRIDVQDDGPGLDEDSVAHAWDPLFTTKNRPTGGGLGLAYVKQTAVRHDGRVALRSTPGVGTTATLWLPALGPAPSVSDTSTPLAPHTRRTVLLVEDDPVVARAVTRQLYHLDRDVLAASTGAEALQLAQRHHQDIGALLCDLHLPDVGGPELIEALRDALPAARLIVSSGEPNLERRADLLASGADAFLPKPYGQTELREVLATTPPIHATQAVHSAP